MAIGGMFAGMITHASLYIFWGMTYEHKVAPSNPPSNPLPPPEPHGPKIHEVLACRLDQLVTNQQQTAAGAWGDQVSWLVFFPRNR